MKHPDLNFYMVLMSLLVSGANLFLYCFYGNRSTNDYGQMALDLYESNWYTHPVGLQKFFKMIIANAQRPLYYDGFQIVQLNLETYLKVEENSICMLKKWDTFHEQNFLQGLLTSRRKFCELARFFC